MEMLAASDHRLTVAEIKRLAGRAERQSELVETLHEEALRDLLG
jgi:hypothetical protein